MPSCFGTPVLQVVVSGPKIIGRVNFVIRQIVREVAQQRECHIAWPFIDLRHFASRNRLGYLWIRYLRRRSKFRRLRRVPVDQKVHVLRSGRWVSVVSGSLHVEDLVLPNVHVCLTMMMMKDQQAFTVELYAAGSILFAVCPSLNSAPKEPIRNLQEQQPHTMTLVTPVTITIGCPVNPKPLNPQTRNC